MIIRVFRAHVRTGKAAEFKTQVREVSVPLVRAQKGLLMYLAGEPLPSEDEEFVMVTLWDDLNSLKAFAGQEWWKSVIPDSEIPLLERTEVQHYTVHSSSDLPFAREG